MTEPLCRWCEQPEGAHPTYTQFGTLNCSEFELRPSERVKMEYEAIEIDGDTARVVNPIFKYEGDAGATRIPPFQMPSIDYGGEEIVVSHPRRFGKNPATVLDPSLERIVTELAGLPAKDLIMVLRRASYVRNVNATAVPRMFNERMDFEKDWDARVKRGQQP